ncbi:unnamed protein product [Diamesa hyperborea]
MITLTRKIKKSDESNLSTSRRISIRDKLLVKEIQEMEENLPTTCKLLFPDANILHEFILIIQPNEGMWTEGKFKFSVAVSEEYNMQPPKVKCLTKLFHPNISIEGDVCLSLLRLNSIDGLGWLPTRRLKDVIFGINSLFTDLLNFEDPLNQEAAMEFSANNEKFKAKVREYVLLYARR